MSASFGSQRPFTGHQRSFTPVERVVSVLFGTPRVDNDDDVINRDRGLGDVGRNHDLALAFYTQVLNPAHKAYEAYEQARLVYQRKQDVAGGASGPENNEYNFLKAELGKHMATIEFNKVQAHMNTVAQIVALTSAWPAPVPSSA